MRQVFCFCSALAFVAALAISAVAAESDKYTLRYKFHPGETIRWEVEHRTNVRTSVSGTTQNAETLSTSIKRWRVTDVEPDGAATFEHSVERVDMRQKLAGCNEVRYNSQTDAKAPAGFEDVAKSVGVPLSTVTMDAKGKVLHRERHVAKQHAPSPNDMAQNESSMTIPLPADAVPVGYTWTFPHDIDVPLESGGVKRIKAVQQFTLEDVKNGVATIRLATEVLTPITNPAIEAQLVQREAAGRVRFDIDAGRIIGQQLDIDKHVVGFRGEASSIHYMNRFSEQLVREEDRTARKPQ
jgi:hypothetical protein